MNTTATVMRCDYSVSCSMNATQTAFDTATTTAENGDQCITLFVIVILLLVVVIGGKH